MKAAWHAGQEPETYRLKTTNGVIVATMYKYEALWYVNLTITGERAEFRASETPEEVQFKAAIWALLRLRVQQEERRLSLNCVSRLVEELI